MQQLFMKILVDVKVWQKIRMSDILCNKYKIYQIYNVFGYLKNVESSVVYDQKLLTYKSARNFFFNFDKTKMGEYCIF